VRPLLRELVGLARHVHAAQHERAPQAHAAALPHREKLLMQLHAELTRRREDHRITTSHLFHERVQDRQRKCQRFAGSSLRATDHVAALEDRRDRCCLDGRRCRDR